MSSVDNNQLAVLDLEDARKEIAEKKQRQRKAWNDAAKQYRARLSPEERRRRLDENALRAKEWQEANRPRRNQTTRARLRALKEELVALKGGKCVDCGGVFPAYAYDFHHVGGKDKKMNSFLSTRRAEVLAELDKCVLLCAVCHRGRHVIIEEEADA